MRLNLIGLVRLWLLVSLFSPLSAWASMEGAITLLLNFTNATSAKTMAKWSDQIDIGNMGLGWAGPTNASRDIWIESVPQAVGWSWRPVIAVSIRAEILPSGKFVFLQDATHNQVTYPKGELYARYSADKKHWSSWQSLAMERPAAKQEARQIYSGTVRTPYRDHARYGEYLSKFSRMDVPWRSDEEALAKWIIEQEPAFFEKQIPFVGYVQFLFETRLKGEEYLEAIKFDLSFGAGGLHSPPKHKSARENRDGPWRYEAP